MNRRKLLGRTAAGVTSLIFAGLLTAVVPAQIVGPTYPNDHIYPSVEEASTDIHTAILQAGREHKRVILDFGGDWCPDCQVLNIYFNQSPNRELLDKYFIRVNINIGHEDANVDIAHHYGVPLQGVPALAVLDSHGKLLYAQNKEFADMRHLQPSDLTAFLNKWKP